MLLFNTPGRRQLNLVENQDFLPQGCAIPIMQSGHGDEDASGKREVFAGSARCYLFFETIE